jgi:hypothetical protein
MADIKNFSSKIKKGFTTFYEHWYVPKKGFYVPYREWVAQAVTVGGEESAGKAMDPLVFGSGAVFSSIIFQIPFTYYATSALIVMPLGYLWSIVNTMIIGDNLGHLPRKASRTIAFLYVPLFIIGMAMLLFVPSTAMQNVLPGFFKVLGSNIVISIWGSWRNIFWKRLFLMKQGRFKPAQYINLVPYIVVFLLLVYMPFGTMGLDKRFWIMNLLFQLLGMYGMKNINPATNVCSPNESERVTILALPGTVANGINSIFIEICKIHSFPYFKNDL